MLVVQIQGKIITLRKEKKCVIKEDHTLSSPGPVGSMPHCPPPPPTLGGGDGIEPPGPGYL